MLVQADMKINATSYRYRCQTCRVVMGYDGNCCECKEESDIKEKEREE